MDESDLDEIATEWLTGFPRTRYISEWRLLVWEPRGILDGTHVSQLLRWLELVEPRMGTFNRFIDLSGLSEVRLRFDDVVEIAARRREKYSGRPVKTVMFADSPVAFGVARMYEQLMSDMPIEVHVVAERNASAFILGVPNSAIVRVSSG